MLIVSGEGRIAAGEGGQGGPRHREGQNEEHNQCCQIPVIFLKSNFVNIWIYTSIFQFFSPRKCC